MLVDTSILVEFLRGGAAAREFFERSSHLSTSVIVVMEIIAGLPKKADIKKFEKFLRSADIPVYPINSKIAQLAYDIFCSYHHQTNVGIPDALIAATALYHNQGVITLNEKHFRPIKGLRIEKPF